MGWGHFDGLKPWQHVWSSCRDDKPLWQQNQVGNKRRAPFLSGGVGKAGAGKAGDGFIWMLLGLDTTLVDLCHGFVCLVGGRAQNCSGTAEIPKSFMLGWIRDLKSCDMCFFNTHNGVVWCLVNSCLTAELTAVGFTHPLEMLKLEKKI